MRWLIFILFFLAAGQVLAEVASSTNYQLEFDSLNFGGEDTSTSTNFELADTLGENATGVATSTNYQIEGGYRAMLDSSISISTPNDLTLTAVDTYTGGSTSGSASWTVITDNPAGYTLTIKASSNPALQSSGGSFANYTLAGVTPDYTWSVAASAAEFGFTPSGNDIVSRYQDNGSACNAGASDTADRCWDPLTTSETTIASDTSGNTPTGTATTVKFQAEIGSDASVPAGSYTATITATALAL